jgi:ubiquitin-protein ligase E3 D
VAEHHENLNHVLVFLTIPDLPCGVDVKAEVVRSFTNSEECEHFVIHYGSSTSAELDLPVSIVPGQIDVKVQRGHFELKLSTPSTNIPLNPTFDPIPLLDASQLSISNPTSFVCASCSLPIVQSSKISSYRDLPSEHWEELVDAWMCHTDQSLHEQVARHGRGFWPDAGQALIGGSYILFEESSVVMANLFPAQQPKVSSSDFKPFFSDDQEDRRWLFTDGCLPLGLALPSVDEVKPSQVSRLTRWLWLALRGSNKPCFRLIQSVPDEWRLRR